MDKVFYTAILKQASSDFSVVRGYVGSGIYIGGQVASTKEHEELFLRQLKDDGMAAPEKLGSVTELRTIRYGDMGGYPNHFLKLLIALYKAHLEQGFSAKMPAGIKDVLNVHYVGKNYVGRIDRIRPLLGCWDREYIRDQLKKLIDDNAGSLTRNERHIYLSSINWNQ